MDPSLLETLLFGILKQFLKSKTDTPFHSKELVNHVCTKRHFLIWKKKSQSTFGSSQITSL